MKIPRFERCPSACQHVLKHESPKILGTSDCLPHASCYESPRDGLHPKLYCMHCYMYCMHCCTVCIAKCTVCIAIIPSWASSACTWRSRHVHVVVYYCESPETQGAHTRIHTYTHTRIHAYMHTHIHTYTHTHIHTYMHTCIHAYTHTRIHK